MMPQDKITEAFAEAATKAGPPDEKSRQALENLSLAIKGLQDAGLNASLRIHYHSSIESIDMMLEQSITKEARRFATTGSGRLYIGEPENSEFYTFSVLASLTDHEYKVREMSHICIANRPGAWSRKQDNICASSVFNLLDEAETEAFQKWVIIRAAEHHNLHTCDKGGVFNRNSPDRRVKRPLLPNS